MDEVAEGLFYYLCAVALQNIFLFVSDVFAYLLFIGFIPKEGEVALLIIVVIFFLLLMVIVVWFAFQKHR